MENSKIQKIDNKSSNNQVGSSSKAPPASTKIERRKKEDRPVELCNYRKEIKRIEKKINVCPEKRRTVHHERKNSTLSDSNNSRRHPSLDEELKNIATEVSTDDFEEVLSRGRRDTGGTLISETSKKEEYDYITPPSTASSKFGETTELELKPIDSDLYNLKKPLEIKCNSAGVCKPGTKDNVLRQLQTLGYGTGFHVPLTDKECKELEEKIEQLQEQNLVHKIQLHDDRTHNDYLKTHVDNLQKEVESFKRVIESTKRECENADTLATLAERVEHRILTELQRTNDEFIDYCKRNNWREELFNKIKKRVEDLTEKYKIGHEKMEYFRRQILENEDIMQRIKNFKTVDEKDLFKFEEQDHELVWLNRTLRMELDVTGRNTEKLHELYNRMSADYRKAFKQRQELLAWWNKSVEQMKNRDGEINAVGEQYFKNRNIFLQLRSKLKAAEKRLIDKGDQFVDIGLQQKECDRKVQTLREKIEKTQEAAILLKDEYLLRHIEVQQTIVLTKATRKNIKDFSRQNVNYGDKAVFVEAHINILKNNLIEQEQFTNDYKFSVEKLESMITCEEKKQQELDRQIFKIRQFIWERHLDREKINEHAQRLDERAHRIKIQISILEGKSLFSTDRLADRQGKNYRLDLDLSTVEVKTIQFLNEIINPKLYDLKQRRNALKVKLDEVTGNYQVIYDERYELEGISHVVANEMSELLQVQMELKSVLNNVRLEESRYLKSMDFIKGDLTKTLVDLNLFKLLLAKTERKYQIKTEGTTELAQRKASLEAVAKERKQEISQHQEFLTKQLLEFRKRNAKLRIRTTNVDLYIQKLMGKFQMILRLMASPDGDYASEEETFADHIRRMAQEKEILSSEAKRWENRIEEALKEVEGLRNALLLMQVSNANFKKNLTPANEGCKEDESYQELLENEKKFTVMKRRSDKVQAHLLEKEKHFLQAVARIQKILETQLEFADQKRREASKIEDILIRQKDQIQRWEKLLASMRRIVAPKMDEQKRYDAEIEMILIGLKEKYDKAVSKLDRFLMDVSDSRSLVYEFLEKRRASIQQDLVQLGFPKRTRAESERKSLVEAPSELYQTYSESSPTEYEGEGTQISKCDEIGGEYYCELFGGDNQQLYCEDVACETVGADFIQQGSTIKLLLPSSPTLEPNGNL